MPILLYDHFSRFGRKLALKSNAPVMLDNPDRIFLVTKGKAEIFAQRFKNGDALAARTYVYTATPGDVLFAAPPSLEGLTLLAVGSEDAETIPLDISHALSLAMDSPRAEELRAKLDSFVIGLGSGLTRDIMPKPRRNEDMTPDTPLQMTHKTIAGPRHGVCWICDIQGNTPLFLGQEEIPRAANRESGSLFPIPENCWIYGTGTGTLQFVDKPDAVAWPVLMNSLHAWAGMALELMDFNSRMALVDTFNTIQHKQSADKEHAVRSVRGLARVLHPVHAQFVPPGEGSALYKVMCRVGAESNIRFTKPATTHGEHLPPGDKDHKKDLETPATIAVLSRIRYRKITLDKGWWKQDHGALLCFQNQTETPVAVVKDAKGHAVIMDVDGKTQHLNSRSVKSLGNTGYTFHKPLPFTSLDKKALADFAIKDAGKDFRLALFMGLGVGLLGLILPLSAKTFFNQVIPAADHGQLAAILYAILGAVVSAAFLRLAGGIATLRLEARMEARLETALWDRLLRMPLSFFSNYSSGNLASRGAAFQRIRESLTGGALVALTAGVFSLANLALLFVLAPPLGGTALLLILIQGLANWSLTRHRLTYLRAASKVRSKLDGLTLQFISGLHQIRAYGVEHRAFAHWASFFSKQRSLQYKAFRSRNLLRSFNSAFTIFALACVFALAGFANNTTMTTVSMDTGTFAAFYVAFGALQSGVLKIIVAVSQIVSVLPQLERIQPILQSIPEDTGTKPAPGMLCGKIDASAVRFTYKGTTLPVVNNISLSIAPGEFVALAGPSGSGKSTLLRLLIGMEFPDTGSICFDDRDLLELDARLVRRKMGVVLQDFGILPGTIRQAIAGDRFPTEEELWNAAEMSQLADDIRAMDKGMDSPVRRNGNNLSGGQRQKLMIARAVLHDPAILIMDEATSALDNKTQARVIERLEQLKSTRVIAAHRLSTIRNADRILVMDQGRIVESGDYPSLMAQKGLFHSMAMRQLV